MKLTPDQSPFLDLTRHRRREEYAPLWPRLIFEGLVIGFLAVVLIMLVMAL